MTCQTDHRVCAVCRISFGKKECCPSRSAQYAVRVGSLGKAAAPPPGSLCKAAAPPPGSLCKAGAPSGPVATPILRDPHIAISHYTECYGKFDHVVAVEDVVVVAALCTLGVQFEVVFLHFKHRKRGNHLRTADPSPGSLCRVWAGCF